ARGFLVERELPVCSPALRAALRRPADLGAHVLLESPRRQQGWGRWLQAAGLPPATGRHRQRFDHYYLVLQAAIDGLGVALGA
ncbi:LysR substrate-binding domain-containing protein, partial [Streptomyces caniscabiei]|uniref:LysR substrate-binding domain-containing protein n=1 Tax=Streptomyces caniscabiei TaxID=2746961 RepID=UPI0038F7A154